MSQKVKPVATNDGPQTTCDSTNIVPQTEGRNKGSGRFRLRRGVLTSEMAGVLRFTDELACWLARLERQDSEIERHFVLEAWNRELPLAKNGTAPHNVRAKAKRVTWRQR